MNLLHLFKKQIDYCLEKPKSSVYMSITFMLPERCYFKEMQNQFRLVLSDADDCSAEIELHTLALAAVVGISMKVTQ